jgi:hypothetical protein
VRKLNLLALLSEDLPRQKINLPPRKRKLLFELGDSLFLAIYGFRKGVLP